MTPEAAGVGKPGHQAAARDHPFHAIGWRLPAHQIEKLVLNQLARFLRDQGALLDVLPTKHKSPDAVSAVLRRASKLADACEAGSPVSQAEIVAAFVRRVTIAQDKVTIEIAQDALDAPLLNRETAAAPESKSRGAIAIEVPVRFRRRGVEAKLVVLGQKEPASEPDANLVKTLARAHQCFGLIVRGEVDGIGAIARAERLDRAYVMRVLCLAFLVPDECPDCAIPFRAAL